MPIYEYQCEKCGQTTEVLQKFSDAPLADCPGCGGPMAKLMSMNSFQLKGNGWYVTDYAGKKNEAGAASTAPKTDAKSAPTGDSAAKTTTEAPKGD